MARGKRRERKVRRDDFGLYVMVGGYVCRPPTHTPSRFDEGSLVKARYLPDGMALVSDETWAALEPHDLAHDR